MSRVGGRLPPSVSGAGGACLARSAHRTGLPLTDSYSTQGLRQLVESIDAVCTGPICGYEAGMRDALAGLATSPGLLTPGQRVGRPGTYARHVLHADPAGRFTIVSLVWDAGQFSPIHAHYTWCGYVVVDGMLQEESFEWDAACAGARRVGGATRVAGDCTFGHAGLEGIHRLGNPHTRPAVSIHVYGVDGSRVASHVNRLLEPAVAA
jgi:predicted metal-dependent enzyme (double-stranded beta helix superfamily)